MTVAAPRLLVDGRSLEHGSATRGIGTYVRGLLRGLGAIGEDAGVALLLSRGSSIAEEGLSSATAFPAVPRVKRRLQPLLDPWLVGHEMARIQPALYHAVEYGQPFAADCPVVVTVHDLIPFVFPSWYPWLRRERLLGRHIIRRATAVIADSESTRKDLARLAGVDPSRVSVVHLAAGEQYFPRPQGEIERVRKQLALPERYLVAAGTFTDPRKQLTSMLSVLEQVRKEAPEELVVTGSQGGRMAGRLPELLSQRGLSSAVHFCGYVPDDDLAALYSGAQALLHTSAYEGFGLPLVEAMACGCPVVAFDNSCVAEVAGGAAALVEDGSVERFAEALLSLLSSGEKAAAMRAAGIANAARFSWEETARKTVAVYRSVSAF